MRVGFTPDDPVWGGLLYLAAWGKPVFGHLPFLWLRAEHRRNAGMSAQT